MQPPMNVNSSDDFQTPPIALKPLLKWIPKEFHVIWECSCGKGNLVNTLKEKGFICNGTDIIGGYDFLKCETYDELKDYDCIITNPPYKYKQQFLEKACNLNKPFAFLLPLTTFETKKRQKLFEEHNLQVIFMDKRINFETPSGKGSGSWFATMWVCKGFNLPKDMIFETLD